MIGPAQNDINLENQLKMAVLTMQNWYSRYAGGCVMVLERQGEQVVFRGTGFLVKAAGYVLTAAHAISPDSVLVVSTVDPSAQKFKPISQVSVSPIEVQIVQFDAIRDIALLKFTRDFSASVPSNLFGDAAQIQIGSPVSFLGFPFGHLSLHTLSMTSGIVSSKVSTTENVDKLQIDNMCHEGNSGGPVIDAESGLVIGMITGRFNPTQGGATINAGGRILGADTNISYAVAAHHLIDVLRSENIDVE